MGTETEIEPARRSDRRRGARELRNPWAVAAFLCSLLGLAAAGAIAGAAAGLSPFAGLPDRAGYALCGAVPSFGLLGLAFGTAAARRARFRWVSVPAIVLASIEVLAAVALLVLLLNAGRSL